MIEGTLEGQPTTLKRLLAADAREWEELFEFLAAHPNVCPERVCVAGLLFEEPSLRRWLAVADEAAQVAKGSVHGDAAQRLFRAWLCRGVEQHATDPGSRVELGICQLEDGVEDPVGHGQATLLALKKAWGEQTVELPRLLVLIAKRSSVVGAHEEAFSAASEAEHRFKRLGPRYKAHAATARRLLEDALVHLEA